MNWKHTSVGFLLVTGILAAIALVCYLVDMGLNYLVTHEAVGKAFEATMFCGILALLLMMFLLFCNSLGKELVESHKEKK